MINRITLVGRTGDEPVIHTFESGTKVAKFSLATSEKRKDKDGNKIEETEWFNIVIFGKLAEVVESWVKKGDLLYLEGKIKTRTYEDKDGNKKYITEAICFTMQMLGSKSEAKPEVKAEIKESDPAELGAEFSDDNFVPPPTTEDNPFVS